MYPLKAAAHRESTIRPSQLYYLSGIVRTDAQDLKKIVEDMPMHDRQHLKRALRKHRDGIDMHAQTVQIYQVLKRQGDMGREAAYNLRNVI